MYSLGDKLKSHVWLSYNNLGDTIEFIIRDSSGAKIEQWKVSTSDKKRLKQIFRTINSKYNVDLFFKIEDKDKDLDWLG